MEQEDRASLKEATLSCVQGSQEVEKDATVNAPLGAPTGRAGGHDQVVPGERAELGKE